MNTDTVRELLSNTQTIDVVENIMAREALEDAAPAVAQWGLEQAQEVARLREVLNRVRGELNGAMASMDVSSALTRQYVGAAWDALSEVVWGDS